MEELERILRDHAARYPRMEAVDYLKLVYQNEFGCGHLASDEAGTQQAIRQEQEALGAPAPSWNTRPQPIGAGLCRLPLAALPADGAPALARLCAATAARVQGSEAAFSEKLEALFALCGEGALPIPRAQMEQEARRRFAAGPAPVRHSAAYRAAYAPHYRVILQRYADFLPAFLAAQRVAERGGLLAIDGRCASGKSTLAAMIGEVYGCPVFHMDDYFLPAELRTPQRFAEPGGNVHRERIEQEILRPFAAGQRVVYRPFDCHAMALKEPVEVPAAPFAVVEGCYALHPALRGYFSQAVFLTHSKEAQRRRILARSGERMLARFEGEWIPLEERYFAGCGVEDACGCRVDTTALF